MTDIEKLIIDKLSLIEQQLDKVRTEDIPNVKTDVALLVESARSSSRWQTAIGSFGAVIVSVFLGRFK